jgi:hypothetical protein
MILLFGQLLFAPAVPADDAGGEARKPACLDAQRFQAGWTQSLELRSWDRIGAEKRLLADVAVRPPVDGAAQFLAFFRKPDDIRGVRLLAQVSEDSNELFLYMPVLFKVRKITGRQISNSVYGTDFSYEDLEWLMGLMDSGETPRVEEQEIDGQRYYVVKSAPSAGEHSRYESLVSYIEQDSCVLHRVDMFASDKRKAKVLSVDPGSIREIGGVRVPHSYTMEDLREGTRTRLTVRDIRLDNALPDTAFAPDQLKAFRGFR